MRGGGLELLLAPVRLDLLELPRPAGEDLGGCSVAVWLGSDMLRRLVRRATRGADASAHRLARVSDASAASTGAGAIEDQQPAPEQAARRRPALAPRTSGFELGEVEQPVALEAVRAAARRASRPPAALAQICASDDHARASHALGQVLLRRRAAAFAGASTTRPDFVARPREETDVERLLEWCSARARRGDPYGGGTSVVGGVTPDVARLLQRRRLDRPAARSIACSRSTRSRARRASRRARPGPRLEAQLGEHGLTLRHFPQSFEFSTLGGWIATRAAGHFATRVDAHRGLRRVDRARSRRSGVWESRRLPGSGAGVSPDRMLAGSEGTLGRDHRGVGARAAAPRAPRARLACASPTFAPARSACARSASPGCTRPTAA